MTIESFPLPEGIKTHTQKVTVPSVIAIEVPNDPNSLSHIREAFVDRSKKLQAVPEFLFTLTRAIDAEIKGLEDTQQTLKQ
tara:strand:- start:378 stop:620 length:243 start_codon:yes stop_codon:yes gene_type:complete